MQNKHGGPIRRPLRVLLPLFCILHSALCISPAFAQVKGEVEMVGFQNYYRPDCWTPLLIRLTPETDKSGDYVIHVKQEDMDRDQPVYTRQVTVTGTAEGQNARDQRFRMYFKPKPTDGGLPDANDITQNLARLQKELSVELWTTNGKFIATLPITSTIFSIEGPDAKRGRRLVLAVTGGRSVPAHREYDPDATIGLLQDIDMVTVQTPDLPESVLGYDAVDSVFWMDADPGELSSGGDERLRALQAFVRRGGHLVISQQTEQWQRTLQFGDMLPVTIEGVRLKPDAEPLRSLARGRMPRAVTNSSSPRIPDPWDRLHGPMPLGVAIAKPGAFVDEWVDWNDSLNPANQAAKIRASTQPVDLTPYIARKTYGFGCVSWIAQDLGDPTITRMAPTNWPVVWNHVFDWKDDPLVLSNQVGDDDRTEYGQAHMVDAGRSSIDGVMELSSKSLWYITVAVVFFIAYWVVAGPGSFVYLSTKQRSSASWFVFAASALVFTLLTIGLVRLMLRGPPELKHMSLVRATPNQPAQVYSRMGLYIPRDGEQRMELKDPAPGTVADLTPFAIPPSVLRDNAPNDIGPEYFVPVTDASSGEAPVVRVPYRSTLKKLEADWTGDATAAGLTGVIEGSAKLMEPGSRGFIGGKLTNGTGRKLREVYIAFKWRSPASEYNGANGDYLLYMPQWDAGATLDINREYNIEVGLDKDQKPVERDVPYIYSGDQRPAPGHKYRGRMMADRDWGRYWYSGIANSYTGDDSMDFNRSMAVLSFFSRMAPDKKLKDMKDERLDMFRRTGRKFDASNALAGGSMVIVAQNDPESANPLPMPLEVDGERVTGTGATLYQFVVPVDNSYATTPSTHPSSD